MKGNLLKFAPLCLLLCWMLPVDSMTIRYNLTLRDANHDIQTINLSMVDDSVDDMYFGCTEKMMKKVKKYLVSESRKKPFKEVWKRCEKKQAQRGDEALTKAQIQAICVYTSNEIYRMFNHAVRTEGSTEKMYKSSFHFHSLHFLLTSAINILNSNYKCHTSYRRTDNIFIGRVGQRIRFGSFTSSSYKQSLTRFGNKTCFKIKTCSGAPLKKYSTVKTEEEVLIPPYEIFSIVKILNGQDEIPGLSDCELVYVLESEGIKSKLNCKLVYRQESSGFSPTGVNNHSAIFKPSNSLVRNELIG
ncbi:hypothetical protein L3Q82_019562 [Scortum barcoo]|uniref:Uncharacterized protein n=1 Tax=Scortum barcoo TaxID=214431 RepID=A0ACB8VC02_9TELE|nr:hypothetical protein L3Q82_019562 [Scortum barcoo]